MRDDKNQEKMEEQPEGDKKDEAEEDHLEGKEEELEDDPLNLYAVELANCKLLTCCPKEEELVGFDIGRTELGLEHVN